MKDNGCTVITTCGARHLAECREIGADAAYDYSDDSYLSEILDPVDTVLDVSGKGNIEPETIFPLMAQRGNYIFLRGDYIVTADKMGPLLGLPTSLATLTRLKLELCRKWGINFHWAFMSQSDVRDAVSTVADMIEEGSFTPKYDRKVTIEEAAQLLSSRPDYDNTSISGKIVVDFSS